MLTPEAMQQAEQMRAMMWVRVLEYCENVFMTFSGEVELQWATLVWEVSHDAIMYHLTV